MTIEQEYRQRFEAALKPLASRLEAHLQSLSEGQPRIDRVSARAKSIDRFVKKAQTVKDGRPKYSEPLVQIQDQIGARIITLYPCDVDRVAGFILKYFHPIEEKELVPETPWSFGYFGRHYVLLMPSDVIDPSVDRNLIPKFFELQIKTLFQHAWSEANHDLGYKPGSSPLSEDAERRLAFASAQAWGADRMFDELFVSRSTGQSK